MIMIRLLPHFIHQKVSFLICTMYMYALSFMENKTTNSQIVFIYGIHINYNIFQYSKHTFISSIWYSRGTFWENIFHTLKIFMMFTWMRIRGVDFLVRFLRKCFPTFQTFMAFTFMNTTDVSAEMTFPRKRFSTI